MSVLRSSTDLGFKALNLFHRSIVRVSGGRIGMSAFGMPVITLHTVGRTSSRAHSTMLTVPVMDSDRIVLVASKGGDDRDPDWFRNLMAHPDAELTMGDKRRRVRARLATEEERGELWPRVIATYKGYGSYRKRTKREIPLVICEPY
jgi:deazaflavin-dependent oxidoreductase (nitroreductase family)